MWTSVPDFKIHDSFTAYIFILNSQKLTKKNVQEQKKNYNLK